MKSDLKFNPFIVSLIISLFSLLLAIGVQNIFFITNSIVVSYSIPYLFAFISIVLLVIGYVKHIKMYRKFPSNSIAVQVLTIIIVIFSVAINSFLLIAGLSGF